MNKNYTQWCRNNPEKLKEKGVRQSVLNKEKRRRHLLNMDLSPIHPEDRVWLLSGNVLPDDVIRIQCPLCGEYKHQTVNNTFCYKSETYKKKNLCKRCIASRTSSFLEKEIADFISHIYSGDCVKNTRDIISPFELDFYYPDKNIAVEFNGTYWHSAQKGIDSLYHFNKFKECMNKGVRLLSIYEYDIEHRRDWVNHILDGAFSSKLNVSFSDCILKICEDSCYKFLPQSVLSSEGVNSQSVKCCVYYNVYYRDTLLLCIGIYTGDPLIITCLYTNGRFDVTECFQHTIHRILRDFSVCTLKAYVDNDIEDMALYKHAGFTCDNFYEKEVYRWIKGRYLIGNGDIVDSRHFCFEYMRKHGIEWLCIDGTEYDTLDQLGFKKIYHCGMSLWVFNFIFF